MKEIKRKVAIIPFKGNSRKTLNKISRPFNSLGIFDVSESYLEELISIDIKFIV